MIRDGHRRNGTELEHDAVMSIATWIKSTSLCPQFKAIFADRLRSTLSSSVLAFFRVHIDHASLPRPWVAEAGVPRGGPGGELDPRSAFGTPIKYFVPTGDVPVPPKPLVDENPTLQWFINIDGDDVDVMQYEGKAKLRTVIPKQEGKIIVSIQRMFTDFANDAPRWRTYVFPIERAVTQPRKPTPTPALSALLHGVFPDFGGVRVHGAPPGVGAPAAKWWGDVKHVDFRNLTREEKITHTVAHNLKVLIDATLDRSGRALPTDQTIAEGLFYLLDHIQFSNFKACLELMEKFNLPPCFKGIAFYPWVKADGGTKTMIDPRFGMVADVQKKVTIAQDKERKNLIAELDMWMAGRFPDNSAYTNIEVVRKITPHIIRDLYDPNKTPGSGYLFIVSYDSISPENFKLFPDMTGFPNSNQLIYNDNDGPDYSTADVYHSIFPLMPKMARDYSVVDSFVTLGEAAKKNNYGNTSCPTGTMWYTKGVGANGSPETGKIPGCSLTRGMNPDTVSAFSSSYGSMKFGAGENLQMGGRRQ